MLWARAGGVGQLGFLALEELLVVALGGLELLHLALEGYALVLGLAELFGLLVQFGRDLVDLLVYFI